ncbi:hypothetical protein C0992_013018 [Termitomyces sp. T32_za158]|nr:hypothetical protein C0992_013018 [Termitomyces sp. T32_za158]
MDSNENNLSSLEAEGVPTLDFHPAYAYVSSQLQDDAERGGKQPRNSRRTSSNNLNVVLRLLSLETARADAAEARLTRDNEAILTRVRNIREAYARGQAELVRVKAELEMYKFQLDLAHKEIRRAQVIVDEADKARIEAEERCTRDKKNIRELVLQRAINEAREEGRREGWGLGLERGRVLTDAQVDIRSSALYPSLNCLDGSQQRGLKQRPSEHDSLRQGFHRSSSSMRVRAPSCSEASTRLVTSRQSVESILPNDIPTLGPDEYIIPHPQEPRVTVDLDERDDYAFRVGAKTAATSMQDKVREPPNIHDAPHEFKFNFWPAMSNNHLDHTISPAYGRDEFETPALSAVSNRSTRISEFDIVRPPTFEGPDGLVHLPRDFKRNQRQTNLYTPRSATKGDRLIREFNDSQESAEKHDFFSVNNLEAVQAVAGKGEDTYEVRTCPQAHHKSRARISEPLTFIGPLTVKATPLMESFPCDQLLTFTASPPCLPVVRKIRPLSVEGQYKSRLTTSRFPSQSPTNTSPGTTINPVLLTPEHANLVTGIQDLPQLPRSPSGSSEKSLSMPSVVVEQLPPGFVPHIVADSKSSEGDPLKSTQHIHAGHRISSGPLETQFITTFSKLDSMSSGHSSLPLAAVPPKFSTEKLGLEYSPAPLDRPISLFSDD